MGFFSGMQCTLLYIPHDRLFMTHRENEILMPQGLKLTVSWQSSPDLHLRL